MGITIGIDLGTTNSVTCIKKIKVSPILNAEGDELTPSCVTAIPGSGDSFDFVVGRDSRHLLKQYPEQTITSVKRFMGRDFDDAEVQNIINDHRIGYQVITEISEPGSIRIPLGGKMQTPEMISGMILSKLVRDGEAELQGKIDQAVVTVPAYFSDRQKFATRAACDYAGIKLLRLLPEPTAAALSFGLEELDENELRTIMVFDLGGGTFDISVLSCAGGSFMEVTKGGDMWLGGDNIDKLLVDHIFSKAEEASHCEPITTLIEKLSVADKARFLVEIKEKAEAAKIELSTKDSATIEMFGLLKDEKGQLIDIDVTVSRLEFKQILDPILKQVAKITEQILHEIRFEPELIDTVLMVGGSSLIPAIQEELKRLFGSDKVLIHPRPMLAIAEGAALMAAKLTSQENSNEENTFAMMHSTAHDYYLQLADGKRHLLVARNTPLPAVTEETLTFTHGEQSLARLRVFNEVLGVLDPVGELWFHKEEPTDKSIQNDKPAEIKLRFSVDEDNIIAMKAWSLQNEQLCIETQIARGGLSTKLYNDLEQTLSAIIANCNYGSTEGDILKLSRAVVSTILAASDPVTGETRPEQKQKAQTQMMTLKGIQQENLAPLRSYQFALIAEEQSADILSTEDSLRLKSKIEELKQALENLDNITKFKTLDEEFDAFYDEVPIAADLATAVESAEFVQSYDSSGAKKIRNQAKVLSDLYKQKKEAAVSLARDTLHEVMDSMLSWGDRPSRRFDRDVRL